MLFVVIAYLALDGHEVAEQRAHGGRELGLVVEVAGLADGLGPGRVRVNHAGQAAEADLGLHGYGHLADDIEKKKKQNKHTHTQREMSKYLQQLLPRTRR